MKYCNISFSENNGRCNSNQNFAYLLWNLPAVKTCPYATAMCKRKCYARHAERYPVAVESRNRNLQESQLDTFETKAIGAINKFLNAKKNKNKFVIVRIHASGDFYSQEYLDKWVRIADHKKNGIKL